MAALQHHIAVLVLPYKHFLMYSVLVATSYSSIKAYWSRSCFTTRTEQECCRKLHHHGNQKHVVIVLIIAAKTTV
jgi:hypothetical protein